MLVVLAPRLLGTVVAEVLALEPGFDDLDKCHSKHTGTCGSALLQHTSTQSRVLGSFGDASEHLSADVVCDEAVWPDKDHDLVCGECKVLVDRFESFYGTCSSYCAAVGRYCSAAWEEENDDCRVKHEIACDQTIPSSDAICQCGDVIESPASGPDDSSCWGELPGAAPNEGNGIGVPGIQVGSSTPCKDACDGNALCQSFTYCPEWGKCWLKDRSFDGSEPSTPGACKTFYKKPCSGAPLPPTPASAPSTSSPTIRVGSYNLWWWNAFKQNAWKSDHIVKNIKDTLNVDTLGLQECDEPDTIRARTSFSAASPFRGAQGVSVRPGLFAVEQSGSRDIGATGKWGPRYVTWAKLTHGASGRSFFHFNSHWCVHSGNGHTCNSHVRHTGAKNMLQTIREVAGTSPVVITGDFNADIGESGPQEFLQNGFELAKSHWVDAIFFSSEHWSLVNAVVGDAAQSDHKPIVAELRLKQ